MLLLLLLRTSDKHVMVCYSSSSSGILDDDTFDEYAVVIYMAVLRRKVSSYNWLVQIFALWRATQFLWNRVSPFNTHIPPALTTDFEILLHQKNAFSPTALRKIHWWTYTLQKIFRTSLIALYIFFFSTCYPQKICPLVLRPSEIIFFSFFAASQKIWSSVLQP